MALKLFRLAQCTDKPRKRQLGVGYSSARFHEKEMSWEFTRGTFAVRRKDIMNRDTVFDAVAGKAVEGLAQ